MIRQPADMQSLKGGVTLVQVREKEVDTGEVSLSMRQVG
jgi:thiamine monophosphate synthase